MSRPAPQPPLPVYFLSVWCPPSNVILCFCQNWLSWILCEVEHLTRCSKLECAVSPPNNSQTSCQFSVSLAQLVSPSVALPAELVSWFFCDIFYCVFVHVVAIRLCINTTNCQMLHRCILPAVYGALTLWSKSSIGCRISSSVFWYFPQRYWLYEWEVAHNVNMKFRWHGYLQIRDNK